MCQKLPRIFANRKYPFMKVMKARKFNVRLKSLLILFLISPFILTMTSCDELFKSDLIGKWEVVSYSEDGENYKDWNEETTTLKFEENGNFSSNGYFGTTNGSWVKKDNQISAGGMILRFDIEVIGLASNTATFKVAFNKRNLDNGNWEDVVIWVKLLKQKTSY